VTARKEFKAAAAAAKSASTHNKRNLLAGAVLGVVAVSDIVELCVANTGASSPRQPQFPL